MCCATATRFQDAHSQLYSIDLLIGVRGFHSK